jgi:hypothetical protein
MRLALPLLSIALLAATAHADTVIFDASGTFASGSTLSGTIAYDTVTGTFSDPDFVTTGPNAFIFNTFNTNPQPCSFPVAGDCQISTTVSGGGLPNLNLVFGASSFNGFTGGDIGSIATPAQGPGGFISDMYFGLDPNSDGIFDNLNSGSLTPEVASPIPEPSSLALLTTGTVSLLGLVRRRSLRS